MKPLLMLAAAMILVTSAARSEESWRAVTRQCDEVAEQSFCVGKAGCPNWEWLAACTAQNYFRDLPLTQTQSDHIQSRYPSCIAGVKARRTQQRASAEDGDAVAAVFGCLLGQ